MNKTAALSRLTDKLPLLLLAAFSLCSPNLEARHNVHLNDTVAIGMNAIDHILQRPSGNPVFDNKRFGDHLFISGGAGISVLGTSLENRNGQSIRPSYRFGINLGDWITPVHGMAHRRHIRQPLQTQRRHDSILPVGIGRLPDELHHAAARLQALPAF